MARRSTTATPEQWARVAKLVRDRRAELDLKAADIEAKGVSRSTLSSIENDKQLRYETQKLRNLCGALDWTPDSIDRILNGREPGRIVTGSIEPIRISTDATISPIEAIQAIRAQLDELERSLRPSPDPEPEGA